ncbi:hypothetical protein [Xenorhabdus hominickii]|uniref:Uncharacterized protein n=1 Tax=Xenorhabdus hominickii TaxID=351679 RepID=A0A1V0M4Q3_XENHO|nr:hypothetical protein [Xenorhabdus hominickii]ARD69799.1 hypothetical protein [Xenorhabdus hominickii]PHM51925.1 hypothetical protein Xhom_04764 [Xenorhabdus hominickii]
MLTPSEKDKMYKDVGWVNKKRVYIPYGTIFNHGSTLHRIGGATVEGVGQTGHTGDAIWLAPEQDEKAPTGYTKSRYNPGSSRVLSKYKVTAPLTLAALDDDHDYLEHSDIESWKLIKEYDGLDGVASLYAVNQIQEILLFNKTKITLIQRTELK